LQAVVFWRFLIIFYMPMRFICLARAYAVLAKLQMVNVIENVMAGFFEV
jgi:hypothetical protein